jgi:hypothetical protein
MSTRIDLPEDDLVILSTNESADGVADSADINADGKQDLSASASSADSISDSISKSSPAGPTSTSDSEVKFSGEEVISNLVSDDVTIFFPNSLVIVAASGLLESIVCSKCDTSSPILMNKVLDLLMERRYY